MNETTVERFRDVLSKFETAILATVTAQGQIHARPMAIFEIEPEGNVLFITDENSAKVQEIESNPCATVICQNGWTSTVTLTGRATLFRDTAKVRQHWKKSFQAWFPGAPDDPRIVLVRITGDFGEFWDNSGAKAFRYLFQTAKAVATGTRPRVDERDQHGKVALKTS